MKNDKLKKLIEEQKKHNLESFLSGDVEFLNEHNTAYLSGGMSNLLSECTSKTGPCNDLTSCGTYFECGVKCGIKI
jgi:hypothetical protein